MNCSSVAKIVHIVLVYKYVLLTVSKSLIVNADSKSEGCHTIYRVYMYVEHFFLK